MAEDIPVIDVAAFFKYKESLENPTSSNDEILEAYTAECKKVAMALHTYGKCSLALIGVSP